MAYDYMKKPLILVRNYCICTIKQPYPTQSEQYEIRGQMRRARWLAFPSRDAQCRLVSRGSFGSRCPHLVRSAVIRIISANTMNPSQPPITPPVAYAAQIAFEINQMREECSDAARALANRSVLDETALEECACLDEALDTAYKALHAARTHIRLSRAGRSGADA
jgi:hypothetical protein